MVASYMQRTHWEAQLHALAILEHLARVLPKSKGRKVSVDEFLKIAGQT